MRARDEVEERSAQAFEAALDPAADTSASTARVGDRRRASVWLGLSQRRMFHGGDRIPIFTHSIGNNNRIQNSRLPDLIRTVT